MAAARYNRHRVRRDVEAARDGGGARVRGDTCFPFPLKKTVASKLENEASVTVKSCRRKAVNPHAFRRAGRRGLS
jgi:hypothetical protein